MTISLKMLLVVTLSNPFIESYSSLKRFIMTFLNHALSIKLVASQIKSNIVIDYNNDRLQC